MSFDIIRVADIRKKNIQRREPIAKPIITNLLKDKFGMALSKEYICENTGFCYTTVHRVILELIEEGKVVRELVRGQKKHFFTWIGE